MGEPELVIRAARADDAARLDEVRQAAFAPVFASFRAILGEELYQLTQASSDQAQGDYLRALLAPGSAWQVAVAERDGIVIGFVSVQHSQETLVGEIGLNAVHPDWAGAGVGTALYEHAIAQMRAAGMRAATVSTGGDDSHAPARRAYAKVGFSIGIPSVWLCRTL